MLSTARNTAAEEYLSELSIEQRRQSGQVYTPAHLVDFVFAQAGYSGTAEGPLLDPACGAGAFLEHAVRLLAAATLGRGAKRSAFLARVESELFGVDVDERACELTTAAVHHTVKLASPGALPRDFFRRNVLRADFLAPKTLDALVALAPNGFSLVVGNPPYVSATRITSSAKTRLRERFATATGRLDLYSLFIERGVRLAAHGGRIAMITPDKFLITQSARALRSFLLETTAIRSIAKFRSHKVFTDAATVPCVTVFERDGRKTVVDVTTCVERFQGTQPRIDSTERTVVAHSAFAAAPWYVTTSDDLAFARRFQGRHPRLAHFAARVSAGPATGRDAVFVFPRGTRPEVERRLLRPAVRGRDIEAYGVQDPNLDILVPYEYDRAGNANLIDLRDYPGAAGYLQRHRPDLRNRHCVRVWQKAWFDLHDQPTVDLATATKILVPDVANSNRFAVDTGRFFPLHSAYYLIPRIGVDPFYLLGILNSQLAGFFVRVFSPVVKDGFNRYRQQFLAEIPIPLADEYEQHAIAEAARRGDVALVDELVGRLFRLTHAESTRIRNAVEARVP